MGIFLKDGDCPTVPDRQRRKKAADLLDYFPTKNLVGVKRGRQKHEWELEMPKSP